MPNTPTKRPHSHISVPASSSSSSSSSDNTTNHGISSNPFEAFMHMFDRNFHRPSQSAQTTDNSSTQPVAAIQHCQQSSSSRQSRQAAPTEYDNMLRNAAGNNTNNNVREGLPSKVRNISTSSSIRTVSTSSTVRTTSASSPTQHCHDDNITSPPAVSTTATSCVWRKAICPHTSKTYYWNIHTRESRWKKPLELASAEEREAIQSKERKQRDFFESMERNILKRLENGHRMKEMQLMMNSSSCDGGDGGADREGSEISLDNYNATNSGGIESSWTHAATTSPTENAGSSSNANEDWIAGWITPTSESSFQQQQQQQQQKNQGHHRVHTHDSPAGSLLSLNSMEGLSVLYPSSTSNQHEQHHHQHGSLSPVSLDDSLNSNSIATSCASSSGISREERDDKVNHHPHNKNKMMSKLERIKSSSSKPVIDKPNLIRTISKMEHDLLARQLNPGLFIQVQASNKRSSSIPDLDSSPRTTGPTLDEPLTPTTMTCDILSSLHLTHDTEGLNVSIFDTMCNGGLMLPISPASPLTVNEDEEGEEEDSTPPPTRSASSPTGCDVTKPTFTKRNTCGTIYLGSTLSAPDKDALIKCVCGVFRAHLLQSERSGNTAATTSSSNKGLNSTNFNSTNDEDLFAIFNDRRAPGDYRFLDITSIPSLTTITDFYRSIFLRSQMEIDCIIISLIYIERLIKLTDGRLTPSSNNWRSILFSCMVLASKVWDDLSMWNCDFSKIGPGGVTFSLARTNELEIALLKALEYKVKVNASEYAKYYFLLRGMLCRSGLANDDMSRLQPLDAKGAATLAGDRDASANAAAGSSDNGTANNVIAKVSLKDRSKSYGHAGVCADKLGKAKGENTAQPAPQMSPTLKRVSLEQIVKM